MKKLYRILLLFIVFLFLTTYNPNKFYLISKGQDEFFKVKNIKIVDNVLIKEEEIKKKLNSIHNQNIFLIKRKDIEEPLQEINFLKKIDVKKNYPNTIIVKIYETEPIAFLVKNQAKYILDSSSNLILLEENMKFNKLPTVFGEEAEKHFAIFLKQLKNNNFPKKLIKNFYYFQIDRWDLQLTSNKIIKISEKNTNNIIKRSVELLNRKDFENYKIIDLRIDGKIIVE